MFTATDVFTLPNLALNVVFFFAGIGAHATWLRAKVRHERR